MTATIEDLDLDWVTFLDEDQDQEKCCDNRAFQCERAAVYVVKWGPDPDYEPAVDLCGNSHLLCLPCYEMYANKGSSGVFCGLCHHTTGKFLFKKIVYSEPIKR